MFKLSRAGEYALRGLIYIAGRKGGDTVGIREIARKQNIPEAFLVKVFNKLVLCGIVRSKRGNRGGFVLCRQPDNISLFDVITAVEGNIQLNDCMFCGNSGVCKVRHVWEDAREGMFNVLKKKNVKELV